MQQQRFRNPAYNRPQRKQHFQRNANFRGRGPRYSYHLNHCETPMPTRNEEHWCETCDRGFHTLDMLESHKLQHQMCKIDGCQFIAHPKVITMHIQMQHSSGLFKKIAHLSNPEDIQKWREERRKKYPTKQNVEKKSAELKEKIERGEKMGLKRDKRKIDGGQKRKKTNIFENDIDKRKKLEAKKERKIRKQEILPLPEYKRKLKPFAGILDLAVENNVMVKQEGQHFNFNIEDDDVDDKNNLLEKENKNLYKNEEPNTKVCGALSSLICEYGSSDEEINTIVNTCQFDSEKSYCNYIRDKNKVNQICQNPHNQDVEKTDDVKKLFKLENNKSNNMEQKTGSDDECPPDEVKVEKAEANRTDSKEKINRKTEKTKRQKDINVKRTINKPNIKLPSTLLQKLLHREIQQERNIVLQSIRHIVKNNFFDK